MERGEMKPAVGNPGSGLVLKVRSSEEDLGAGWTCKVSGPSLTSRVLGGPPPALGGSACACSALWLGS